MRICDLCGQPLEGDCTKLALLRDPSDKSRAGERFLRAIDLHTDGCQPDFMFQFSAILKGAEIAREAVKRIKLVVEEDPTS